MADLQHCIGSEYKNFLAMAIGVLTKEALQEVLGKFDVCDKLPAGLSTVKEVKQVLHGATGTAGVGDEAFYWPKAIYIDENGKSTTWDSPSSLYVHLTGTKPSGSVICDGVSCSAATMVDSFRFHGYIVKGDGEDPPTRQAGMSKNAKVKQDQIWKTHLKEKGLKVVVINSKAPQVKGTLSSIADAVQAANPPPAPAADQAKAEAKLEMGTSGIEFVSAAAAAAADEAEAMAALYEDIYSQPSSPYPGLEALIQTEKIKKAKK